MKRVNIAIDQELHRKAKVIAVLKGINLNDYLEQAVEKALKTRGAK
ncbi:MAG: plasmid partition protein ParG [Candidatus Woesearchaeota archaeon]